MLGEPVAPQVTQLRNGLVKAIEQTSLANPEAEGAVNQLRLALKAVEEALLLLQDCEVNHEVSRENRTKNIWMGNR